MKKTAQATTKSSPKENKSKSPWAGLVAIPYDNIEQKRELEREAFSKLTPAERRSIARSWMKFMNQIGKAGDAARAAEAKVKKKRKGKKNNAS